MTYNTSETPQASRWSYPRTPIDFKLVQGQVNWVWYAGRRTLALVQLETSKHNGRADTESMTH